MCVCVLKKATAVVAEEGWGRGELEEESWWRGFSERERGIKVKGECSSMGFGGMSLMRLQVHLAALSLCFQRSLTYCVFLTIFFFNIELYSNFDGIDVISME